VCNFATRLKYLLNIDDGLDVFAMHAIAGSIGSVMTGIFADDYVVATDGLSRIPGGWIQKQWIQVGYQLAGATRYCIQFKMNDS
jgi:Amt family ammonium transporter